MASKVRQGTYRYLSGRPLTTRPGVFPYLRRGDGRWAGWQRQTVRVAAPVGLWTVAYVASTWPVVFRAAAAAAAVAGLVRLRRWWRHRRFIKVYIRPTIAAVRIPAGTIDVRLFVDRGLGNLVARLAKPLSPAERVVRRFYGRWVEPLWRWPVDHVTATVWRLLYAAAPPFVVVASWFRRPAERAGPQIRLIASAPFLADDQRKMISSIVKAKIPVGDLVERWDQVGTQVDATWTPRKRPPSRVGIDDLLAALPKLHEWEFYLGQGAGNARAGISLHDDSPHIAISAGTGAGKSVFAQLIAVQVLRRGGRVILLDRKGSHRWAIGPDGKPIPGVDYCTQPAQMHEALLRAAEVAGERNTLALYEPEGWDPGQRILVICEELNATIGQLRHHWDKARPKGGPKRSPAIEALNDIAYMGRAAKVNLIAVAQMLTARAIGGPEARENFGIRALARYTVNAWKMLVPEASMPRATRMLGRWQIVIGGQATETQVCFLTQREAREVARVPDSVPVPGDIAGHSPIKADREKPGDITLREACDAGVLACTYEAAKKRMQRERAKCVEATPEPTGTRGNADTYDPDALATWGRR